MSMQPAVDEVPELEMAYLDTLWVQLTGTVCNIACRHCFISCGPKVTTHEIMPEDEVKMRLAEALELGVRSVWFTGGEPMMHDAFLSLVGHTLTRAPLGVLTNGMLVDHKMAQALGRLAREHDYNLEIRVSLDGVDSESNDAIRGRGVFERATQGVALLAEAGLEPVLAVAKLDDSQGLQREAFLDLLTGLGVTRPRVKWIPPFRLGREATRKGGRGYMSIERLSAHEVNQPDASTRLQCGTSRTVTHQGVFPCPILINEPRARLGDTLMDSARHHAVDHSACTTCWEEGFSCSA
jgi:MoaA/NifB/PqqE/SkfB family radical SAM enzyme